MSCAMLPLPTAPCADAGHSAEPAMIRPERAASASPAASAKHPRAGSPLASVARLGSGPSVSSLMTARSASLSPGPPRVASGLLVSPRRFSSRHVPHAAEELAQSPVLPPDILARLNGLTRHLKGNSEWEEKQKQVLEAPSERFIPEEYDETLHNDYERRCAFGERMNTEFMSSGKWVKLLRELGVISAPGAEKAPGGSISLADADIIFRKVLHHADYCGKRLTYETFCKALYLAALAIRPDLDSEAALADMVARVAAAAPEESQDNNTDYMLDANVLLVLDHFKPALWDLFRAFCSRNLGQAGGPRRGEGTVRLGERTFRRHTQDTLRSTLTLGGTRGEGGLSELSPSSDLAQSPQRRPRLSAPAGMKSPGLDGSLLSPFALGKLEEHEHEANYEADAGGGFTTPRQRPWGEDRLQPPHGTVSPKDTFDRRPRGSQSPPPAIDKFSALFSPNSTMQSFRASMCSLTQTQDTFTYANGAPVIKNRRHYMSADQFLLLCKDLKIMPDLLTRLEIVKIFKRAQCTGASSSHGSSIHGFLNRDAFVDAVGQLAIEAYCKEPYGNEFPEAYEKVHGFLARVLPTNSHEAHERFLYGCGTRAR
uniref:EF-hand domain-containing protein n=1 Tax=Alexandrium monilatum TaxID=311494 RepID=A0A7S4VAZ4_9DINO